VAHIFRRSGASYRAARRLPLQHLRVMRAIEVCRTAALGGHVERCGHCHHQRVSYNSCRNRHCPKCQSLERARWLEQRKAELLPVEYFHVVFTVPEPVAALALHNQRTVYSILFRTAAQTLLTIARDPRHLGAEIGFFAILHTWGQNLLHHPHLHCVVPGGGIAPGGDRWIASKPGFFLPVRVLSRLFRRLFLDALQAAFDKHQLAFFGDLTRIEPRPAFAQWLAPMRQHEWVVYAKPPFGGPQQVLEYLGRYTHRVAISNQRLVAADDHTVTFRWKDYRHPQRPKTMTVDAHEFIRRFLLHVLPPGFQRIRHYGLMSNSHRHHALAECRRLLSLPITELLPNFRRDFRDLYLQLTAVDLRRCPVCKIGTLIIVEVLPRIPYQDTS
jgi:hypothetical protein